MPQILTVENRFGFYRTDHAEADRLAPTPFSNRIRRVAIVRQSKREWKATRDADIMRAEEADSWRNASLLD